MYISNYSNSFKPNASQVNFQSLNHRCIETETYNKYIAPIENELEELAKDCDIVMRQGFDDGEDISFEYAPNRPEQGFRVTITKHQPTGYEEMYGVPRRSIFIKKQDDILGKVSQCKDDVKVRPYQPRRIFNIDPSQLDLY